MRILRPSLRTAFARTAFTLLTAVAAVLPAHAAERGPTRARSTAVAPATPTVATAATEARVIVKYRADASILHALSARSPSGAAAAVDVPPQHAQVFAARLGVALTDGVPIGPRSQVLRATGITSADLAQRLAAQTDVEYAVADQRVHALRVPNDPLFLAGQATTPATGQWYLRTPGVDGEVASINAEGAWDITTGTASVVVAVIDTGITAHPDLAGKVLPGYDFISDATTAGDGNGRDSDPTDPGDGITASQVSTITGCTSKDVGPSSWHGTQTAGLIGAATNNATGMASVGWNVMLLPLRALGRCGGSESDVIAAMQWAAGIAVSGVPANPNKARVINLSLGGTSGVACDPAYQDAVNAVVAQGVVVVAAAGNDGLALGAPANCTGVVAVAGVRNLGSKVGYSDLGPNVTIAAPAGNCVNLVGACLFPLLTTANDGMYSVGNATYSNGGSDPSLGTSFSAPLVSGTVALMLSANPALTPSQVSSGLRNTARGFPSTGSPPLAIASATSVSAGVTVNLTATAIAACRAPDSTAQSIECYCTTSTCGSGLLDAGAAVAAAAGLSVTPATPPSASPVTISSYQWTISRTTGSATAVISGSANQPVVTVATGGVGTFTADLTTIDSANQANASSTTVTVTAAAPVPPPVSTPTPTPTPTTGTSGGGGGGGSVSIGWLLGLLAAVAALCAVGRRPRRSIWRRRAAARSGGSWQLEGGRSRRPPSRLAAGRPCCAGRRQRPALAPAAGGVALAQALKPLP